MPRTFRTLAYYWAVLGPSGDLLPYTIRARRADAVWAALLDGRHTWAAGWPDLYREGWRAVKIWISPQEFKKPP